MEDKSNSAGSPIIRTTPLRYYVVVIFDLMQFCAAWHLQFYTSIPDIIRDCYEDADVDSGDINLTVSIGCLFSILFAPLLPFLDRFSSNIRVLLIISATVQFIQILSKEQQKGE